MSSVIRIKRRAAGGAAGAPSTLANAELAFNETDSTLYIGVGTGGSGGSASTIQPIAGNGAFVDKTTAQTVAGVKTFSSSPVVPTLASTDSSTNAANGAFVQGAISGAIAAQKGAANGLAPLGADAKISSTYLPSYVDDVLEFTNLAGFPATGETGKIYTALDTNKIYRWSGSVYIEISGSPGSTDAVPEGATNKYFTESRVLATVLAGLSTASSAVITATDSVLSAFGKLQAQIALRLVASNNLSDLVSPATARTNLGLGTMATQNASAVAITGGSIDGVTLDGGTY